ncbi:hypothetical protein SZN_17807 [Streptomyces zinciresistens K42]|uniref:Oxidoreductase n=1 Tax=Streptomyces zinciresistens K42 TaxID=700597 RepID=G2GDI4_9ACTN|nr:hypothetical protein [Streptomyces zinciresistens]EGX58451.1 hypothetical protein SZN_17807 [Streptomyces zinciresistens K42]
MVSPSSTEPELIQGGGPGTMMWVRGTADRLALPASALADAVVYAAGHPGDVDLEEVVIRPVRDAGVRAAARPTAGR